MNYSKGVVKKMSKLLKDIGNVLCNECGGPNLEELLGIAYSLGVGAGLFVVGRSMKTWLNGAAGSVGSISYAVPT